MEDTLELHHGYDQLECFRVRRVTPQSLADRDMAADLQVLYWLERITRSLEAMPGAERFRAQVMRRIRRRSQIFLSYLAVAAVCFFWISMQPSPAASLHGIIMDAERLGLVEHREARIEMRDFLLGAERLFVALRDVELVCDSGAVDVQPETLMAKELLLQQKQFSVYMDGLDTLMVRDFFQHMEMILVDLNSLDPCAEPAEIEAINAHVNSHRILTKLRLMAQEIEVS